jgi:hypothetical protein
MPEGEFHELVKEPRVRAQRLSLLPFIIANYGVWESGGGIGGIRVGVTPLRS